MDATFGPEQYPLVDSANANSTRGGVCSGDSGGPVLVSTASELILVGVITGAQLGNGHCATKSSSGFYQTQFTMLSRYSNLAFSAASTALSSKEAETNNLHQQNQELTSANTKLSAQVASLTSTNQDQQAKLDGVNTALGSAQGQIDSLQAQIVELTKKIPTTITCLKGKLIKQITGVNPTCPAGYKKK
jgi:secreted trypsin-like serine protease